MSARPQNYIGECTRYKTLLRITLIGGEGALETKLERGRAPRASHFFIKPLQSTSYVFFGFTEKKQCRNAGKVLRPRLSVEVWHAAGPFTVQPAGFCQRGRCPCRESTRNPKANPASSHKPPVARGTLSVRQEIGSIPKMLLFVVVLPCSPPERWLT